jgi:hypothetical protein
MTEKSALEELHEALVGHTQSRMICPSCFYIKEKPVTNTSKPYVVVIWNCPCGRMNHTKIATKKPLITRILEDKEGEK